MLFGSKRYFLFVYRYTVFELFKYNKALLMIKLLIYNIYNNTTYMSRNRFFNVLIGGIV